jgi:hypothetical protein
MPAANDIRNDFVLPKRAPSFARSAFALRMRPAAGFLMDASKGFGSSSIRTGLQEFLAGG